MQQRYQQTKPNTNPVRIRALRLAEKGGHVKETARHVAHTHEI